MRASEHIVEQAQATRFYKSAPFAGQTFSGVTGTIGAGLASGGAVAVLRYSGTKKFALSWLHVHVATIVAFTTAVTAGRRLHLRHGTGGGSWDASAAGGSALDASRNLSSGAETLVDGRIASTGALTVTGLTFGDVKARLLLAQVGNSGSDYDEIWRFDDPLILLPNEVLGLVAGAAFDAGGTWQANIKGGGFEASLP